MRKLVFVLLSMLLLTFAPPSSADVKPAEAPKTIEEWRALADGVVAVHTDVSTDDNGKYKGLVEVQTLDKKLAEKTKTKVYDGAFAMARLAVRPGAAAVLLFRGGGTPFVKVGLVDLDLGTSKLVDLPRTAPKGFLPTSAVACADADGFTLVWQEQDPMQPNSVHSTMARVKADGTILKKPTGVAIEWGLGAIVATDAGYMLAVRYDGGGPDQTRICFVTLSNDGQPQEHPWWGSRPAQVNEIEMVVVGKEVKAIYRAGAGPESILAVTVDKSTGSWGKEAEEGKVLASKVAAAPFAVRVKDGKLEVVRR